MKKAARFTQLDWVQAKCEEKLGFRPYPGTLNLEIPDGALPLLQAMQQGQCIQLIPPDGDFCTATALPLSIGSIPGALIIPAEEVRVHGSYVVEVIAPLRIKDALRIDDGDSLTLRVRRPAP